MHILAFDTALAACSAAVCDGESRVLARESVAMRRGHAEALIPMIGRVMAGAGLAYAALQRIAVTTGPGTFTGLRVGMAAARGLALATGAPLVGIGTLEALAAGFAADHREGARPFLVALDAHKGEVYAQPFAADGAPAAAPALLAPAEAARRVAGSGMLICGSGAGLVADALVTADKEAPALLPLPDGPDPVAIARLAAARPAPDAPPSLLYLRPPDARPQATRLLRPPVARDERS